MSAPDIQPPESDVAGRSAWVSVTINLRSGRSIDTTIHLPDADVEPSSDEVADGLFLCVVAGAYGHSITTSNALMRKFKTSDPTGRTGETIHRRTHEDGAS